MLMSKYEIFPAYFSLHTVGNALVIYTRPALAPATVSADLRQLILPDEDIDIARHTIFHHRGLIMKRSM